MRTIKYIGDGTKYFVGVPMQDLTQDEWDALPAKVKTALIEAKLFDAKEPKAAESAAAPKSNKGGG